MRWRLLLAIVGAASAVLLGTAACQRYHFQMAGDVKDVDGQPLEGCKVELLVRRHMLGDWSGYVSRDGVTNAGGAFSFSVFAPSGGTYRLRVKHPGYQEWLLDAASAGAPTHVHITLRRLGAPPGAAGQSRG
jgi:hypothetical protein